MNDKKCYTVYMHRFPDGKVYVGLTKQSVQQRWGYNGCGYKKQPVYNAIKKYGWDNIEHILVKDKLTYKEAQNLEKELIEKYDSIKNGYNNVEGGGLGGNHWVMFEYNGKQYTADELALLSHNGITSHDLTTRINYHGWNIEDAMTKPKTKKNSLYEYKGSLYTIKELLSLSPIKGLNIKQLNNRINKHGWDIERAITQPLNVKVQPKGIGDRIYEYNGKMYNSYELWLLRKVDDITVFDITNRINNHEWTVEEAISKPKKKINKKYEYKGKLYNSNELVELAKQYGVYGLTNHNITDRINHQGWSVHKAITTPKVSKKV